MGNEGMTRVECFFDCTSPWTYMGVHSFLRLSERLEFEIIWRPIIVGGVFNAVNRQAVEQRERPDVPRKNDYGRKDMQDWARYLGLTVNAPPKCGHPVNGIKVMRACLVMQDRGKLPAFAIAAFEALWIDGRDLALDDVLGDLCRGVGEEPDDVLAAITRPEIKQRLRDNTDDLIARNGFGSPTWFVNGTDMYFGNDRIPLLEAAILRDGASGMEAAIAP